mmetsp:Transcript_8628/g.35952  ORF Transcript_8628/g.35952 Transcript_8628/m.35952 type:complete len:282 (-) Transcript_8628:271-1116(-)
MEGTTCQQGAVLRPARAALLEAWRERPAQIYAEGYCKVRNGSARCVCSKHLVPAIAEASQAAHACACVDVEPPKRRAALKQRLHRLSHLHRPRIHVREVHLLHSPVLRQRPSKGRQTLPPHEAVEHHPLEAVCHRNACHQGIAGQVALRPAQRNVQPPHSPAPPYHPRQCRGLLLGQGALQGKGKLLHVGDGIEHALEAAVLRPHGDGQLLQLSAVGKLSGNPSAVAGGEICIAQHRHQQEMSGTLAYACASPQRKPLCGRKDTKDAKAAGSAQLHPAGSA